MGLSFFLETPNCRFPDSRERRFFVDGTSPAFRADLDIELSHWNPNNTDDRYRADSSTEIALNYLMLEGAPESGLVVNNHLDVDGVLAAFSLLRPEPALRHREILIGAAEIGDFWAWANRPAMQLYQGLIELIEQGRREGNTESEIHRRCCEAIPGLLEDSAGRVDLSAVDEGLRLLDSGSIPHRRYHHRFVAFVIPRSLHGDDYARALHVPEFNAPLDDACILGSYARNRYDNERIQLVSVEAEDGWYHDLLYPGYMWAEIINRWRAPGFWEGETSNTWYFRYAPLDEALRTVRVEERNEGSWTVAEEMTPFDSTLGRGFPVVASFLSDEDLPTPSSINPDRMAEILRRAYTFDKTSRR